jgi:hypothetical protein
MNLKKVGDWFANAREAAVELATGIGGAFIDMVTDIGKEVKTGVKTLTGQNRFDALKEKYVCGYNNITAQFKNDANKVFDALKKDFDIINTERKKSADYFQKFENTASAIADWDIAKYRFNEIPRIQLTVPEKTAVSIIFMEADYDKNPIWQNIKGLFTFGNKSALNEAELKIKGLLSETRTKCQNELLRWEKIAESIKFIRGCFVDVNDIYIRVINELQYAIQLVKNTAYQRDIFTFPEAKVNPYFLPRKHVLCLMACDRLSRVLCEMSKKKYLSEKDEIIDADLEAVSNYRSEIEELVETKSAA